MRKTLALENLFLLTIFCMPLYLVRVNIFDLPTNIFEIIAFLTIVIWVFQEKKNCFKKINELPPSLLIGIFLILAGFLLSILFSDNYRAGFGILKSWFLIPIFFSYTLWTQAAKEKFIEKIFLAIFLSSAFVGFIAIIYKLLGVMTYDGRLAAFYLSPNHIAMYLAPGIFFGCYFLIKQSSEKKYSRQFFRYVLLLLTIIIPLYFTYSYGAWLAVFIPFVVLFFFVFTYKKILPAIIFSMFIAIIFLFQINTSKFSDFLQFSERSSLASRIIIWKSSLLMIKQNPILGIGPGNFQSAYLANQQYFPPYLEWAVPQPHNIFLAFWLQTGIAGLLGFLLILFFAFHLLLHILKNKKDATLAAPLFGFFLYTVLHGILDTPYWKNDLSFLFWICVFLTCYFHKKLEDNFV